MSGNKYYAVRKGRDIGIFNSWAECEKSIKGFSGAEYKSFPDEDDAKRFLVKESEGLHDINKIKDDEIIAYVDGSYNDELKHYGSGIVMIDSNKKTEKFNSVGNDKDLVSMRNVAGELMAAVFAMEYALENNYKRLYLHYDYEGIEKWCNGAWKTNKIGTKKYKETYNEISKNLKVIFIKVKAHSGDFYNDEADRLASLGFDSIELGKIQSNNISNFYIDKRQNIFKRIITANQKAKNIVKFKFGDTELTEGKAIKFVREVWKSEGNKMMDIDNILMNIDGEKLMIMWKVIDKDGTEYHYEFKFSDQSI